MSLNIMPEQEELTPEQEELLIEYRDRYINALKKYRPIDKGTFREVIDFVYELIDSPPPRVVYVSSPRSAQLATNFLVENPEITDEEIHRRIKDQDYDKSKLTFYPSRSGLQDYELLVYYSESFNKYQRLFDSRVYGTITFSDFVVASEMPQYVDTDEQGRIHSTTRPAIKWVDGYCIHSVHGVVSDEVN